MRAYEFLTEAQLDEINRRDFLRHGTLATMGAALGTAALDQGTHPTPNPEFVAKIDQEIANIKAKYEAGELSEVAATAMIEQLEKTKKTFS